MSAERLLFFDTETTGKANFRAPAEHPSQPRLVQLAALLTDGQGKELASINVVIHPKEFEIPREAAAVHGITTEAARLVGVPLLHALFLFSSLARVATGYVCHNVQFDSLIAQGECGRMSVELPELPEHCTMQAMTGVCCLPGAYGARCTGRRPRVQRCFLLVAPTESAGGGVSGKEMADGKSPMAEPLPIMHPDFKKVLGVPVEVVAVPMPGNVTYPQTPE